MKWDLYGSDRKDILLTDLEPKNLESDLHRYQEYFGEDFGIPELLTIMDIKAKATIAEAINDAPEFLIHQLCSALDARGYSLGDTFCAIDHVAEAIENLAAD